MSPIATFIALSLFINFGWAVMWYHQLKINRYAMNMFRLLGSRTGLVDPEKK